MSKATTHLDDVEAPNYSGDGQSTIDFSTPEHLAQPDGVATIDLGDVAGADRVVESVENAFAEPVVQTGPPTHQTNDNVDGDPAGTDRVTESLPEGEGGELQETPAPKAAPKKAAAKSTATKPAETKSEDKAADAS